MSGTAPQTIANEVAAAIGERLLHIGQYISKDAHEWRDLMRRCEKLQKVDSIGASELKSQLFQLAGDVEQAIYWAENISKNGDAARGQLASANAYVNLGFVSMGAALLPAILRVENGQLNRQMQLAISMASFSLIAKAALDLRRAGGTVEDEALVAVSDAAANVLETLDVQEARVQAMLDEAGTILRDERLLWLKRQPDIAATRDDSASLGIFYRLLVSPRKAADLTWALAEKLAAMDLIEPGVSIGFIGEELKALEAA